MRERVAKGPHIGAWVAGMTEKPKIETAPGATPKPERDKKKTSSEKKQREDETIEEKMKHASEMVQEDDEALKHLAKRVDEDELKT